MTSDALKTSNDKAAKILRALRWFYFIGLALCAVYLAARWKDIPAEYPIHWGVGGKPNGFAHRNIFEVFWPLGLVALIGGAVFLTGWVSPKKNAAMDAVNLLVAYMVGVPLAFSALYLPFRSTDELPKFFFVAECLFGVAVLIPIVLSVFATNSARSQSMEADPRKDSKYWKWGIFYHNPDDPDLWVEKRFGWGWTLNMARPQARLILWVFLALILAPILFSYFLARLGR